MGKRIGEEIDAGAMGLAGYKILITGASDRTGIPAKKLYTSILERFCTELCDYIVFDDNRGSSQLVLNMLEQENMFLVPLDNQRHWYRYHHLFSEMLFHSLHRSTPGQIPILHRKASEWFEALPQPHRGDQQGTRDGFTLI